MLKLKTQLATEAEAARANERFYRELAEAAERSLAEIEEEWVDISQMPALSGAEKAEVVVRSKPAAAAVGLGRSRKSS